MHIIHIPHSESEAPLSILRQLLRQLRHFHGAASRRRLRRRWWTVVVSVQSTWWIKGEPWWKRRFFHAKWIFFLGKSWQIHRERAVFKWANGCVFFLNPSKMEVYRWDPFKIHRSHDGHVSLGKIFGNGGFSSKPCLTGGWWHLLDTWVQIN